MIGAGTIINSAAIVAGGLIGHFAGRSQCSAGTKKASVSFLNCI